MRGSGGRGAADIELAKERDRLVALPEPLREPLHLVANQTGLHHSAPSKNPRKTRREE
jgi:hypothetical protein